VIRRVLVGLGFAVFACAPARCPEAPPATAAPVADQPVQREATQKLHAPGRTEPGVTLHCDNYATVNVGSFQYMNNMFGIDQAQGPYDQCVLVRTQNGKQEFGWTWIWTGFEPFAFAFPEVIFGWKPWSEKSTDARLPIALANLGELSVRYRVDVSASGAHNLTLAAWLTDTGSVSPQSIAAEVVVWLDATPGVAPTGTLAEQLKLDGVDYELWVNPNHGDRGDGKGWDLFYLRNPGQATPVTSGTVQVGSFLGALIALGKLRPESWVASLEFGNELKGGSGTLWVRDFDVVVKPRG